MNLGESTYPLNDLSVYVLNGGNAATNVSYEKFSITIHGQASGTGKLNTYIHLAVPQFVIEDDVMISTYSSDTDLHQYLAVFFGTWNITSSLALKSELAYIHNDFNGYLDKSKNTWRMRLDATYTYKDMMINVYGKVKETRLENTGIEEEDFFRWGANARYNLGQWILEVGVNNIFIREMRSRIVTS